MAEMWFGALLFLSVWWDGVPATCVVDTGATVTLMSRSLAGRLGTLSPELGTGRQAIWGHRDVPMAFHTVPNVGTREVSRELAYVIVIPDGVLPAEAECLLGTNYLRQAGSVISLNGPSDGVYGRRIMIAPPPALIGG